MRVFILLLAAALSCANVHAAVPQTLNYQGYLTSSGGTPVNATVAMVLKLYTASSGGMAFYGETQSVVVSNGVFDVVIGSVTPLALPFDVPYYLGVSVGSDAEMTPRWLVTASPYARRAAAAETVNGTSGLRLEPNATSPNHIAGYPGNSVVAGAIGASIGGGGSLRNDCGLVGTSSCHNEVTDDFGTVGGGYNNVAGDAMGTTSDASWATVGGGANNQASSVASTIGGGALNTANSLFSTVSGGYSNTAGKNFATVGGGELNTASGSFSSIPGGVSNNANGDFSFAAGANASANQTGCFVFANWSTSTPMTCLGAPNIARFGLDHGLSVDYHTQRADGGGTRWVAIGDTIAGDTIATWTGAFLSDAGVWVNASSARASKTDFAPVDPRAVLEKVAALPITTWRYKAGEGPVRHIGPMAEDFWSAFQVGYGAHTIADLDARGVALAAIQGLNAKFIEQTAALRKQITARDAKLKAQAAQITTLKEQAGEIMALKRQLAELRTAWLAGSRLRSRNP
jgi:hypothetical protein